jgi:hypothetical protein
LRTPDRVLWWNRGVMLTERDLEETLRPAGGWPTWVTTAPYRADAHPQASGLASLEAGANCQRYAYAVLELFDRHVPAHRSSELWEDANLTHRDPSGARDLDLALFNHSHDPWGAHIAVVFGGGLLHLCAEERRPAMWSWSDFATRPRYSSLIGIVRSPRLPTR